MALASKLALIKEMIENAESSLRSAKQMLGDLTGAPSPRVELAKKARTLEPMSYGEPSIVEGVFDGQNMIGPDGKSYPVPANYASKSKLVQGDVLKLTIMPDGAFVYKQIGPVERKRVIGTLIYEDGQYRVLCAAKAYKVLLASVTYYRASVGDQITLLTPEFEDSDWGAIENVLPASEVGASEVERSDEEAPKTARKKRTKTEE